MKDWSILTRFENVQVSKLQEVVPIVEVCDVDFVIIGHGVLHPSPFGPAIGVVSHRLRDGGQSVLALLCEGQTQKLWVPRPMNLRIIMVDFIVQTRLSHRKEKYGCHRTASPRDLIHWQLFKTFPLNIFHESLKRVETWWQDFPLCYFQANYSTQWQNQRGCFSQPLLLGEYSWWCGAEWNNEPCQQRLIYKKEFFVLVVFFSTNILLCCLQQDCKILDFWLKDYKWKVDQRISSGEVFCLEIFVDERKQKNKTLQGLLFLLVKIIRCFLKHKSEYNLEFMSEKHKRVSKVLVKRWVATAQKYTVYFYPLVFSSPNDANALS